MPSAYDNVFHYYRGPSSRAASGEETAARQVEDNTTKALINTLQHDPQGRLGAAFLQRFLPGGPTTSPGSLEDVQYFQQGGPAQPQEAPARHLMGISVLGEMDAPTPEGGAGTAADESQGRGRIDAAIHVPGRILVAIEVKVGDHLDADQLARHRKDWAITAPPVLVGWADVHAWAVDGQRDALLDPVARFLLDQFVGYLETIGLSSFHGFPAADFEFFEAPTWERQARIKARLGALWEAAIDLLKPDEGALLGAVHIGRVGLDGDKPWAQTNHGESRPNLTVELGPEELRLNLVGWRDPQERAVRAWLESASDSDLRLLGGYKLHLFRRRAGNYDNRATAAKPWWQRSQASLIGSDDLAGGRAAVSRLLARIGDFEEKWEKPALQLSHAWTRREVEDAGRGIAERLAVEVPRLLPALASMRVGSGADHAKQGSHRGDGGR